MTFDIGLMVVVAFLVVCQLWWQTHVPLVILATCAGFVLTSTWGPELVAKLGQLAPFFGTDPGQAVISLTLFVVPPVVTASAFSGTMSHRMLQQFIPALFWVLFILAFALKLLPISYRQLLLDQSQMLTQLNGYASWTVLLAVGVAMIELLSQHDLLKVRSRRKNKD